MQIRNCCTVHEVTTAIEELLSGEHNLFPFDLDPVEINNGSCEAFAAAVAALLKFPANLNVQCPTLDQPQYYGHVWLVHNAPQGNTYFDSEVPHGVASLDELPYFAEGQ